MMSGRDHRRICLRARKRWLKALYAAYRGNPNYNFERLSLEGQALQAKRSDEIGRLVKVLDRVEAAAEAANLSTTRFVVVIPADQTVLLLGQRDDHEWGNWTTIHSEARLFTTRQEAEDVVKSMGADKYYVEVVVNVDEFVTREDTW